jgi:hypothetical protein
VTQLGIDLFVGTKTHKETKLLLDKNYFEILGLEALYYNLDPNGNFFQTKEISGLIFNNINQSKNNIIDRNPFKERYNNNNDLLLHLRLDDAAQWSVGIKYYLTLINSISFDKLYVTTDQVSHPYILEIKALYPNVEILNLGEIKTFQFASTCKSIILSHGSFSAVIGYLAFFSKIYYPDYGLASMVWFGDMFSIDGWNKISL